MDYDELIRRADIAYEKWKAVRPDLERFKKEREQLEKLSPDGIVVIPCEEIARARREFPLSDEQRRDNERRSAMIRERSAALWDRIDALEARLREHLEGDGTKQ